MRIGIDLGGTKILVMALDNHGEPVFEKRIKTPRHDYQGTIRAIESLVSLAEQETGASGSVGVSMPGSLSPRTGLVQNANSTWLNNKPFQQNLETALERRVRLKNDADCFALSEAIDGAGQDHDNVFGVIIGTGCGGGLVTNRQLHSGPRSIAGEMGAYFTTMA